MICNTCRAAMRLRLPIATRLTTALPRAAAARQHRPALPHPLSHSSLRAGARYYSAPSPSAAPEAPSMTAAESAIADVLAEKLAPTELLVQDVSGGCGSMYAIEIASPAFRGQSILKQQRLVNAALGDMVKAWHGVQIRTKVPPE
ncbi:bolA-like protein [Paramyrothecium foliicola]|nr:bolA-like protein [Paramyrothecium foliicola]